jgi:hypothetical protein
MEIFVEPMRRERVIRIQTTSIDSIVTHHPNANASQEGTLPGA